MKIIEVGANKIEQLAVLFNHYRQYYDCEPDFDLAQKFLKARFKDKSAFVYGVEKDGLLVGFALAYRSFCSIDAKRIYILHDLWISENERRKGYATALIEALNQRAQGKEIARVDVIVGKTNIATHALLKKTGYSYENDKYSYFSLFPC